jgi:putative transposase
VRERYEGFLVAGEQVALRMRLRELAGVRVRYGYRRLHVLLRREGWPVNHKPVYRLYRDERLQMRAKTPRRHKSCRVRQEIPPAKRINDCWAMDFIRPGKPAGNALIESFNGRLPAECLNENWFLSLDGARRKVEAWRRHYNEERPHGSLGNLAPGELVRSAQACPA